jgi:hypothetical protein
MNENIILAVKLFGYALQFLGVSVLLWSNASFYHKAKKEFDSVKKKFVDAATPRFGYSDEDLKKANADEALTKFPLAELLYKNYRNGAVGVIITMLGVVISFAGLLA